MVDLLRRQGFTVVRQRGSHVITQRSGAGGTATVPVPDHRELRQGTLAGIIRQSGVPADLFEH